MRTLKVMTEMSDYDLEQVYDDQIAPLMAQIISICKEYELPMLASFQYKNDSENGDYCSTYLEYEGRISDVLKQCRNIIYKKTQIYSVTTTKADGSIEKTIIADLG